MKRLCLLGLVSISLMGMAIPAWAQESEGRAIAESQGSASDLLSSDAEATLEVGPDTPRLENVEDRINEVVSTSGNGQTRPLPFREELNLPDNLVIIDSELGNSVGIQLR